MLCKRPAECWNKSAAGSPDHVVRLHLDWSHRKLAPSLTTRCRVLENECDLVNMSYGEATATPNAGTWIRERMGWAGLGTAFYTRHATGAPLRVSGSVHHTTLHGPCTHCFPGRFIQLAEELVYKHNVIYVASAGETVMCRQCGRHGAPHPATCPRA